MDEMEFTEAESNMNDLVSEYQQYQVTFVLIFFTVLNDFKPVLRIWIRWIRKILASWIRIRIQGAKYQPKNQPKTAKKNQTFLLSKPKSELLKKARL